MGLFAFLPAIGSILGGVSGILGSRKSRSSGGSEKIDIAQNMLDQARGARLAAKEHKFNPLSMLQYGQPAGGGVGLANSPTPPLASIDMLANGLRDINDIRSGDAARRRQADILELDMAKLKYEQARSGVVMTRPAPVAAAGVGPGPSPLGQRPAVRPSVGGTVHASSRLGMASGPASGALTQSAHPVPSPTTRGREMIPVIYPDGKVTQIPRGSADRLGIKPGGTLVAGDIEELKGEFVGNVETTARSPDIAAYQHGGSVVEPATELEFDPNGRKFTPPLTYPDSKSWWLRPAW